MRTSLHRSSTSPSTRPHQERAEPPSTPSFLGEKEVGHQRNVKMEGLTGSLRIGWQNIFAQSGLSQSKKKMIEQQIKDNDIDVLHIQEIDSTEKSFIYCEFLNQHFTLIRNNSSSGFGTATLVNKRLEVKDILLHPSGRLIMFNIEDTTHVNLYLQAGQSPEARQSREDMIGKELLDYLLLAKTKIILGGDFNCVCSPQDMTNNVDNKISNNLVRIVKMKKMTDTYRSLYPKVRSYSFFYTWKGKNDELRTGASRLDRSYTIGNIITKKSSYVTTSFSDHHLHLLEVASNVELTNKDTSPSFKPYFKMAPVHFPNQDYRELIKTTIREWEALKTTMELTEWWDHLKEELKETAKKFEKEHKRDRRARLDLLMMTMEYEADKVEQGALDHLPELVRVKREVNNWFEENSKKVIEQ